MNLKHSPLVRRQIFPPPEFFLEHLLQAFYGVDAPVTSYSPAVLLHLRSVASERHVVAKQTAELIKAYGLRRPDGGVAVVLGAEPSPAHRPLLMLWISQ